MPILVIFPSGPTVSIVADLNSAVIDVEKKIYLKNGNYHSQNQELFFEENKLKNIYLLKDYGFSYVLKLNSFPRKA